MTMHPSYRVQPGLTEWAREVLGRRVYAVLSTVNPDGSTHTVPVGFAFDGERFLIQSGSRTRKVRNIEADERVRVLVQAPTGTMEGDGWVAADGRAQIVGGAEAQRMNAIANGRYLTDAGKAAYEDGLGPLMDLTIVVTPERWQVWRDETMFRSLLEQGYSEEEIGGCSCRPIAERAPAGEHLRDG